MTGRTAGQLGVNYPWTLEKRAFILPIFKTIADIFPDSAIPSQLNERQNQDINQLCHSETLPRPPGMPDLNIRLAAR
jgi:hypothetical protein